MKYVDLVSIKSLDVPDENPTPKTITITEDIYLKHMKIKAEYLNEYEIIGEPYELEDPKKEQPKDKIVKVENEQLIPKVDPEKLIEDDNYDPFVDNVHEGVQEINSFIDKPKNKKERKKAIK
jgi:hypothetical protein